MEQTVYLDLLFLVNFSMDFLCFYISSRIISSKFNTLRVVIASVLGGIYADAALFLSLGGVASLVVDLLFCLLMCSIVYAKKGGGDVLFSSVVYFSVSMALGGFMTAVFNMLNKMGFNDAVIESGDGDGISVWLFALMALVSGALTLLGGRFFKRRSSVGRVEVELVYEGKKTKIDAMVDTGNLLHEPISGKACVVVDGASVASLLPPKLLEISKSGRVSEIYSLPSDTAKNIRLIPTATASGEGVLIAVRPEKISIDAGRGAYEVDAMLALSKLGRSADRAGALVPAELLK